MQLPGPRAVLFLLVVLALPGQVRANLCDASIYSNQFVKDRIFTDYVRDLGPELEQDLLALGAGDLVIDYGAGNAVAASQIAGATCESASEPFKSRREFPSVVAIAFQKGGGYDAIPNLHYLTGRLFKDVPLAEILPTWTAAQLGIDYWGIIAYTSTLSEDLDKIAKIQQVGSRLYVRTSSATATERSAIIAAAREGRFYPFRPKRSAMSGRFKGYESTLDTTVVQQGGNFMILSDWLATLPQFKVTRKSTVLILERTADRSPVPALEFIKATTDFGKPYPRLFVAPPSGG